MKSRIFVILATLAFPLGAEAQLKSTGPAYEPDMNIRMRGFRERVLLDTMAVWQPLPGSPIQTFRHALQVLDSLKIPVSYADSIRGVIHHYGFVARSQLAKKPISQSFRCGMGLSGDYADTWRVSIAYAIFVKPDGGNSKIGVAFITGANDVEGVSKPAVQCGSTGRLEQTIAKAVGLRSIQ
ncbi:MAG TPA: hypothetical protein VFO66_10500 [Gemmatimonadaceae bacterium]|nr:hypothetical protein [Gemmatimonadaceae bacterium]